MIKSNYNSNIKQQEFNSLDSYLTTLSPSPKQINNHSYPAGESNHKFQLNHTGDQESILLKCKTIIESLQEELEEQVSQNKLLTEELQTTKRKDIQIEELTAELTKLKTDHEILSNKFIVLHSKFENSKKNSSQEQQFENKINSLQAECQMLISNNYELAGKLKSAQQENEIAQGMIMQWEETIQSVRNKISRLELEKQDALDKLDNLKKNKKIKNGTFDEMQAEIERMHKALNDVSSLNQEYGQKLEVLLKDKKQLAEELKISRQKDRNLENDRNAALEKSKKLLEQQQYEIESLKNEIRQLNLKISENNRLINDLNSQISSYENKSSKLEKAQKCNIENFDLEKKKIQENHELEKIKRENEFAEEKKALKNSFLIEKEILEKKFFFEKNEILQNFEIEKANLEDKIASVEAAAKKSDQVFDINKELKEKLAMCKTEFQQLKIDFKQQLQNENNQIEYLNEKIRALENQNEQLIDQIQQKKLKIERIQKIVDTKSLEIDHLNKKLAESNVESDTSSKITERKYEQSIVLLQDELEKEKKKRKKIFGDPQGLIFNTQYNHQQINFFCITRLWKFKFKILKICMFKKLIQFATNQAFERKSQQHQERHAVMVMPADPQKKTKPVASRKNSLNKKITVKLRDSVADKTSKTDFVKKMQGVMKNLESKITTLNNCFANQF